MVKGNESSSWKHFHMFSFLNRRKAVSVILTPRWVLQVLSVALNLHLWQNKFTPKKRNFPIKYTGLKSNLSHPAKSALHRRYPLHYIYHFLTDSSEQLQPFLKTQNMRTVRSNQVSVIFTLLATKRPFKTLFSFHSNKKENFQVPASYPGERLLRKNSGNVSG